jgi:hypothetical protein
MTDLKTDGGRSAPRAVSAPRRRRCTTPVLLLFLAVPATGCGATLWPSFTARSESSASELFACAVDRVKSLRYAVRHMDEGAHRLDAHRQAESPPHRSYEEIRRVDELHVEVPPERTARASSAELRVQAITYSMHSTRRGPTRYDEYASDRVKSDARAVVEACGGPGRATAPVERADTTS